MRLVTHEHTRSEKEVFRLFYFFLKMRDTPEKSILGGDTSSSTTANLGIDFISSIIVLKKNLVAIYN